MIRSIKRNMARQRMKKSGYTQMNKRYFDSKANKKRSRFARLWRDFVHAPVVKKRRKEHRKEWPGDRKAV